MEQPRPATPPHPHTPSRPQTPRPPLYTPRPQTPPKTIIPPLHASALADYTPAEQAHILQYSHLARHYILSPRAGSTTGPPLTSQLPLLPLPPQLPTHLDIYAWSGLVRAFSLRYTDHNILSIGYQSISGRKPTTLTLDTTKAEKVVEMFTVSSLHWGKVRVVTYVEFTTSEGRVVAGGELEKARKGRGVEEMRVGGGGGVRGFWGRFGDAVDAVGVVWGREEEEVSTCT